MGSWSNILSLAPSWPQFSGGRVKMRGGEKEVREEERRCWWHEGREGGRLWENVSHLWCHCTQEGWLQTFCFLTTISLSAKSRAGSSTWQVCCRVTQETSPVQRFSCSLGPCFLVPEMWILWSVTGPRGLLRIYSSSILTEDSTHPAFTFLLYSGRSEARTWVQVELGDESRKHKWVNDNVGWERG